MYFVKDFETGERYTNALTLGEAVDALREFQECDRIERRAEIIGGVLVKEFTYIIEDESGAIMYVSK